MRLIHEWPETSNFLLAHLIKAENPETGEQKREEEIAKIS